MTTSVPARPADPTAAATTGTGVEQVSRPRRRFVSSPTTTRTRTPQPIRPLDPHQPVPEPITITPITDATLPNTIPQRPTDSCQPSGRALPGAAAFNREAGSEC